MPINDVFIVYLRESLSHPITLSPDNCTNIQDVPHDDNKLIK